MGRPVAISLGELASGNTENNQPPNQRPASRAESPPLGWLRAGRPQPLATFLSPSRRLSGACGRPHAHTKQPSSSPRP